MPIGSVKAILERDYAWVRKIDWTAPESCARAWYVSEEKLEPRLGFQGADPGIEKQMPLPIGRRVRECYDLLTADIDANGDPIDLEYAQTRQHFEPLIEMMQIKGNSEVHRAFWAADEFADFENGNSIQKNSNRYFSKNDFVREGLKRGLAEQQKLGTNPYQLGFIGGTDSHNGLTSDVVENDFIGGHGPEDGSVERRRKAGVGGWIDGPDLSIGSIAGVWAEENTRESLNSYQQHAAINTVSQMYYQAGLVPEARDALTYGMEVSKQPYYFMSSMGHMERLEGNDTVALKWYRKAWEASSGGATRVQWGTNYVLALLKLSPDDLAAIDEASNTVLSELAAQDSGLRHRSVMRMNRLSSDLLEWGGDDGARQQVLARLRAQMEGICARVSGDVPETCDSFLQLPQAA